MNKPHSVTIKDIAQQLKLSPSTVSRALRDSKDIKPETRLLVRQVAEELHYSPNPIALSLKEKRSKIIGVIVPEIANTFCSATIAGIEDIAYKRGYHVMIFQSHEAYEREVASVHLLESRRMDGLIISVSGETRRFDHLEEMNAPMVMFDRVHEGLPAHKVVVDDKAGAFQGVEHLIQQGFRDVAIISMAPWLSITENRLNGYKEALKKHKIPLRKEWMVHCDFNPTAMDNAIRNLFSGTEKPNALFFSVERLAISCLKVLGELGLRIPEDVALAGFSDNPVSPYLAPALTSIRQPTFEIGQISAELLIEQIEDPSAPIEYKTIQLNTTLDIRASSLRNV